MRLICGDCLEFLPSLEAGSVDAVCTDPPYGLEFMGKEWDKLTRNCMTPQSEADQDWNASHTTKDEPGTKSGMGRRMRSRPDIGGSLKYGRQMQEWHGRWAAAVLRVLKPGGYMLSFGGTRTYHRLACAIEDAGWELRDCIMWIYGSGMPKGKGCLKPAYEPILLCRKPGKKVLPLQIDVCRVPTNGEDLGDPSRFDGMKAKTSEGWLRPHHSLPIVDERQHEAMERAAISGRWPANVILSDDSEVLEAFAAFGEKASGGKQGAVYVRPEGGNCYGDGKTWGRSGSHSDTGTAARFFYCAKASKSERGEGNSHPCVKPLTLVEYLCRLITPPGGTVLDPFIGSGTTALACMKVGLEFIGIERDPDYAEIARCRIAAAQAAHPLFAGSP